MSVNITYDPSTFVVTTATPRQWRVRFSIERNGVTTPYDLLFPDDLQTFITNGQITQSDLKDWLLSLVMTAARKKDGVD